MSPKEILKVYRAAKKVRREIFNCWGFTCVVTGWSTKYNWLEFDEMDDLLLEKTQIVDIDKVQPGDIFVYRGEFSEVLLHTAVYVGNDMLVHKPGRLSPERIHYANVEEEYEEYGILTEVRRPV